MDVPGVLIDRTRDAFNKATPPPDKMPSSTAAGVAFSASSCLSMIFSSTSLPPSTRNNRHVATKSGRARVCRLNGYQLCRLASGGINNYKLQIMLATECIGWQRHNGTFPACRIKMQNTTQISRIIVQRLNLHVNFVAILRSSIKRWTDGDLMRRMTLSDHGSVIISSAADSVSFSIKLVGDDGRSSVREGRGDAGW